MCDQQVRELGLLTQACLTGGGADTHNQKLWMNGLSACAGCGTEVKWSQDQKGCLMWDRNVIVMAKWNGCSGKRSCYKWTSYSQKKRLNEAG